MVFVKSLEDDGVEDAILPDRVVLVGAVLASAAPLVAVANQIVFVHP